MLDATFRGQSTHYSVSMWRHQTELNSLGVDRMFGRMRFSMQCSLLNQRYAVSFNHHSRPVIGDCIPPMAHDI